MISFFGDYNTTETVNIPFNTFDSNDPTASVTITNLVAGDIEIHKDGSTTQRSSDNGVTVTIDFDSITGNHMAHIDLSDNTDAGFYADGSRYQVRIEGTTVDGGTINAWIGAFSIGCTLRPTTAGRTLDIQSTGEVDANLTMIGGGAQSATDLKDLADTGYDPSTHKIQGVVLTDTCATNTDMRGTDSAALNTVCTEARLAELDAANLPADIDTILADTDELQTNQGNWATATGFATEAKQDTIDTVVDAIQAKTDNLPAAPAATGDIPSAATISDAVWDETIADHLGVGATGTALNAAGSAGDPWATAIPGAYGAGTAGKILGDNIDAPISTVDTVVDAIKAKTDNLPASPAATGAIPTAVEVRVEMDSNSTKLSSIETDTQDIQSRIPAALVSGRMSSDAVSISGSTDAADKLEASAETIVTGLAQAGTLSTTQMTTNLTEVTDDHYNGRVIIWKSGVLIDQATDITDYDGASKMLTFTATTEAPSNGDTFVIV